MEVLDMIDIMDIMNIMDIMDIMIITVWLAMGGDVSPLVKYTIKIGQCVLELVGGGSVINNGA